MESSSRFVAQELPSHEQFCQLAALKEQSTFEWVSEKSHFLQNELHFWLLPFLKLPDCNEIYSLIPLPLEKPFPWSSGLLFQSLTLLIVEPKRPVQVFSIQSRSRHTALRVLMSLGHEPQESQGLCTQLKYLAAEKTNPDVDELWMWHQQRLKVFLIIK